MNTLPSFTPAYMVEHYADLAEPTRTFFQHESLLMARKNAIAHAEAELKQTDYFVDEVVVNVYLVETTTEASQEPRIITQVFQNYKGVDATAEEIASGLSPEVIKENRLHYTGILIKLQKELEYYQANAMPVGLGTFRLNALLQHKPYPIRYITVLFDAMAYATACVCIHNLMAEEPFGVVFTSPTDPAEIVAIAD